MKKKILEKINSYENYAVELQRGLTAIPALAPSSGGTGEYDKAVSFDPSLLSDNTRLNLGVAYVHTGQLAHAQKVFEDLLSSKTLATQAQANLDALLRLRTRQGVNNK